MRILSHYFIARYLGLFLTVLAAALILLIAVELVLQLDTAVLSESPSSSVSTGASSWFGSWQAIGDRLLAYYLPDLLPIVSFIAAFLTFAWAGRSLETVALQAGGIRIGRVILPVIGTALMLSLATAILHETFVLRAEQSQRLQGQSPGTPIDFGQKEFWFQKGRTITNVAQADAASRILDDVEIFERGVEGRVERVIRAERVRIADDGRWQVENARIWSFDSAVPDAPPLLEKHPSIVLDLESLGGDALLGAEPGLLPLRSFMRYLDGRGEHLPSRERQLMQRLHQRLSRPWLVLLFAWIALPFALLIDQAGRFIGPALEAAATLGLFFLSRGAGETLVHQGLAPASWATWIPIGLFAATAAFALRRRI